MKFNSAPQKISLSTLWPRTLLHQQCLCCSRTSKLVPRVLALDCVAVATTVYGLLRLPVLADILTHLTASDNACCSPTQAVCFAIVLIKKDEKFICHSRSKLTRTDYLLTTRLAPHQIITTAMTCKARQQQTPDRRYPLQQTAAIV